MEERDVGKERAFWKSAFSHFPTIKLSLGYTGTKSAANTHKFSNSDGFGGILFSLPEWAKICEGFCNIRGGIWQVLKCSKPAEYSENWSRIFIRAIFGIHSDGIRPDSVRRSGHSRQIRAYSYCKGSNNLVGWLYWGLTPI